MELIKPLSHQACNLDSRHYFSYEIRILEMCTNKCRIGGIDTM